LPSLQSSRRFCGSPRSVP